MAQFDVYPNPSDSASHGMPYVVVLQSDLLQALPTRVVLPLARQREIGKVPLMLCPLVTVKGEALHALAHFVAPLPTRLLKAPVGNLSAHASELVAAVDVVLSGV